VELLPDKPFLSMDNAITSFAEVRFATRKPPVHRPGRFHTGR
jgi:hypothetical protein